jgi:TPR repeat protein
MSKSHCQCTQTKTEKKLLTTHQRIHCVTALLLSCLITNIYAENRPLSEQGSPANPTSSTQLNKAEKLLKKGETKKALTILTNNSLTNTPKRYYLLAQAYSSPEFANNIPPIQIASLYQNACIGNYIKAYQYCAMNYIEGVGVLQDFKKSQQYFEKAILDKNPEAMTLYANLLFNGKFFPINRSKAHQLFKKAALLDYGPAQFSLANSYFSGLGVSKDTKKAKQWYLAASKKRIIPALIAYAKINEEGLGNKKDLITAHQFYNLASSQGAVQAQRKLAQLSQQMSRVQLTNAQKKAQSWQKKHWTSNTK